MNDINVKITSELGDLYENDFALWLEQTVKLLKAQDFQNLDLTHLIEEIESLGKSQKRELESRLATLFEHLLKRKYVPSSYDYRGWEETILREQRELKILLKSSPSLLRHGEVIVLDCYGDALKLLRKLSDYKQYPFPDCCPFSTDFDRLLNDIFWE